MEETVKEVLTFPKPHEGQTGPIVAALVVAREKFEPIKKTREGQQGNRKFGYAPLDEIQRATQPGLQKAKLSLVHYVQPIGTAIFVVTELRMAQEEGCFRSMYPLSPGLMTQDRGKEITYGKRYNTNALLDLCVDEDTDDSGQTSGPSESPEELQRKAEADKRLEKLKAEGRLRSAHDGHVIKPGESTEAKPDPEPEKKSAPEPAAAVRELDSRLAEAMEKDGITTGQIKRYYVAKGHFPDSMEPDRLPADYVATLVKPANWQKAVTAMKGVK